jgi:hypothetical protein
MSSQLKELFSFHIMFMTEVCEYEYIIIVYCNTAHELKGTVMKTKSI